jgi:hypothetical protein
VKAENCSASSFKSTVTSRRISGEDAEPFLPTQAPPPRGNPASIQSTVSRALQNKTFQALGEGLFDVFDAPPSA